MAENIVEGYWSERVLLELQVALRKVYEDSQAYSLLKRVNEMQKAFPQSTVLNYSHLPQNLIELLPDINDAHVIEAAIESDARLILTFNTKDFPKEILDLYNLQVLHPDDFLIELLFEQPLQTVDIAEKVVGKLIRPQIEMSDFISSIGKVVPNFAAAVSRVYASTRSLK